MFAQRVVMRRESLARPGRRWSQRGGLVVTVNRDLVRWNTLLFVLSHGTGATVRDGAAGQQKIPGQRGEQNGGGEGRTDGDSKAETTQFNAALFQDQGGNSCRETGRASRRRQGLQTVEQLLGGSVETGTGDALGEVLLKVR